MIKQLLRSENISKEIFDLNEKIANIYELWDITEKIIDKYASVVWCDKLDWNKKLLYCLYLFYSEFFEKEGPFNEDSRTRLELDSILH